MPVAESIDNHQKLTVMYQVITLGAIRQQDHDRLKSVARKEVVGPSRCRNNL